MNLIRWSESISAVARTGLAFSSNLFERERYEEILRFAAEMRLSCDEGGEGNNARLTSQELTEAWISNVGIGVEGYVTPKCAVAAIVGNEKGEILLIQRGDSGVWMYPTGWADVGYSPSEVVVKEVREETGIEVEPIRILAVLDGFRRGFTTIPMYSIVFLCKMVGGKLSAHPLETRDVGWFPRDHLPSPRPDFSERLPFIFDAIDGQETAVYFDPPRES